MTETTASVFSLISHGARVLIAYAVFVLLLLLLLSNWALPYFSVMKPQLLLIVIFYWTLYRPTLMPPWVILLGGLFLDLMNPVMPMGTHAASYLIIASIVKPRRRFMMGQSFMLVWAGFVLAVLLDMSIKWMILSVLTTTQLDLSTILLNGFVTVLAFPILVLVLVSVHRLLPAGRGMITQ
jgi:rod shape-determining protein MreD